MRLMVTAGGTGGHIMPAVAVAQAVRDMRPDASILFVGTDSGMEERIARRSGMDFVGIPAMGIKGKSAANFVKALAVNSMSFVRAIRIVRSFRPDWIVGTGGYVTGMVVLAGKAARCRLAIQEQNSVPGLTNRILAPLVDRVYLSFPDSTGRFPADKTSLVGNPLRRDITGIERSPDARRVLVLGGSQGASSVNRAFVGAIEILTGEGMVVTPTHQCGPRDYPWVRAAYERLGVDARVHAFIDDMAEAYRDARLAVSRCGGITLAELSYLGIPAVMIPYPHAADDHQRVNGAYVAGRGGGWLIEDRELDAGRLADELKKRLTDDEGLAGASECMRSIGLGAGADTIAREITGV